MTAFVRGMSARSSWKQLDRQGTSVYSTGAFISLQHVHTLSGMWWLATCASFTGTGCPAVYLTPGQVNFVRPRVWRCQK